MGTKKITEQFSFSGGKVRREGGYGIVEGVLLCGATSANRRRYRKEAFAGDRIKKYDRKPIYFGHAKGRDTREYPEVFATVENPRHRADGLPIGDISVNLAQEGAEKFLVDAEHKPWIVGLSHVANCRTVTSRDGWEEIEEILEVESVDLVREPATTKSLFENKGATTVDKISLKQFVERFGSKWGAKKWASATKLCEELGDSADVPVMDEPPADAEGEGEGDLKSALIAALTPMLDEAFESGNSDKVCSAVRDFIKLHAKHTGKGDDKPAEEPADDEEPAEESKKRLTPWDVLKECQDADYTASAAELELLATQPDATKRAAYIREQKAKIANAKAERPQSAARRPGVDVTRATEAKVPMDAAAFAASVRE